MDASKKYRRRAPMATNLDGYRRKRRRDNLAGSRSIVDTSKFEQINHTVSPGTIARRARDYFSRRYLTIGIIFFWRYKSRARARALFLPHSPIRRLRTISASEIFTTARTYSLHHISFFFFFLMFTNTRIRLSHQSQRIFFFAQFYP